MKKYISHGGDVIELVVYYLNIFRSKVTKVTTFVDR